MTHFVIMILLWLLLLASPFIVGAILLLQKHSKAGLIVFGVYLASIGSFLICFFIYGNLERRSTVGHIVRRLEGEYGGQQNANDLAEDAKKVVNPGELQQWAMTILQETETTNYPDGEFPRDKVLPGIRNLQSGGSSFEMVLADSVGSVPPGNRSVWIVWGGGFGHWGIRVGPPTFKVAKKYDDNYYVLWKPGIYFWCETH
jgi:hypothetical protein